MGVLQSPVPRTEALALPISVERATQKPTPICIPHQPYTLINKVHLWLGDNTPMDIYHCLILDRIVKVAKFQSVKNKASSKRLNHIYDPHCQEAPHEHLFPTLCRLLHVERPQGLHPAKPPSGFEHGSRLQIYTNILIYINFSKKIFKKYFQLPEFYLLLRMKSSKKIVKGTE